MALPEKEKQLMTVITMCDLMFVISFLVAHSVAAKIDGNMRVIC
jgi:hypothetical protein